MDKPRLITQTDYVEKQWVHAYIDSETEIGWGTVILNHRPDYDKIVAIIEDIEVLPEYRRQGVARQILEKLIQIAKDRGAYKVILDCDDSLISYYRKLGFRIWQNSMRLDLND